MWCLVLLCAVFVYHEQGRLSEEEIASMLKDAETFKEEDKAVKTRLNARNSLESYVYNMKNILDDDEGGVPSKISDADKEVRRVKSMKYTLLGYDPERKQVDNLTWRQKTETTPSR